MLSGAMEMKASLNANPMAVVVLIAITAEVDDETQARPITINTLAAPTALSKQ